MTDKVRLSRYSSLGLKERTCGPLECTELQRAVVLWEARVQQLLGHTDVNTAMICTHVLHRSGRGAQ